ncbi:MAG TPA: STAS domain-containing protein [Actinomycetota bacterium]|nr:STAS domain-containing protein [Vitreimonas sp.]HVL80798.1 STAS domain-containing protein [Actinomycetota bacterium]
MTQETAQLDVRHVDSTTSIVDITGEITANSEGPLMDAYQRATGDHTRSVILNFSDLEYMNSGGIGLLVTLLVRANRQKQRLMAFGLTDHYKQIFELTRLDEAVGIFDTEQDAVAAAG